MENKDNLLGLLGVLYRRRRALLWLGGVAGFGVAVISLFMPNYYRATTTFFAASPDQTKPELIFNRMMTMRVEYYGGNNDIDRLLTIAESSELIDFLVDSFSLYRHYGIDSTSHKAPHWMREHFKKLYDVKKTKRDAIELSIEDTDPLMAARLANAARERIDAIARGVIHESQRRTIRTFEENIARKEKQLLAIGDSVAKMRTLYQIYNVVAQTEALTAQKSEALGQYVRDSIRLQVYRANGKVPRDTIYLLEGRVAGLRQEVKTIQQEIDRLNSGIAIIYNLEKQYLEANQILGEDRERLKQWLAANQSNAPAVLVVDAAIPPVVKSRPRRSILVAAATIATLLLGAMGLLLAESYQHWHGSQPAASDNAQINTKS